MEGVLEPYKRLIYFNKGKSELTFFSKDTQNGQK